VFSEIQTPRSGHPVARSPDHMIWESGSLKTEVFILSSKVLYFFNTFVILFYTLPRQNQRKYRQSIKTSKKIQKTMFSRIQSPRSGDPVARSLDDLIWESGSLKTEFFIRSSKCVYLFILFVICFILFYTLPKQHQQKY